MPLTETALAISSGKIDGAAAPPAPMIEFGIGRVASHHYMLGTSCVPLSLLMTKKKFDSLPADVQAIIRKYSGEWLDENYIRINEASTALIMDHLKSEPRRTVTYPSKADMKTAHTVFDAVIAGYGLLVPTMPNFSVPRGQKLRSFAGATEGPVKSSSNRNKSLVEIERFNHLT